MNNFCTLFDSGYLSRGLALIDSLDLHCQGNYRIYVLAFDDVAYDALKKINNRNVVCISLAEFEDEELLKIKPSRTRGEYCWTCTPSIIKYCLEKFNLPNCTYLDADLYFFSDPSPLFQEMSNSSVLITEHRYTHKYDQTEKSGKYCVQFMTFKNNEEGWQVLNWWRERCIEWCFARIEDGKFGDQKYLDNWMTQFRGIHELHHLGGGVAPWNLQQYNFSIKNNQIFLTENKTNQEYPLVFFHFHALKIYDNYYDLGLYELKKNAVDLIYKNYIQALGRVDLKLKFLGLSFNWHASPIWDRTVRGKFIKLKRLVNGNLNIFKKEIFFK